MIECLSGQKNRILEIVKTQHEQSYSNIWSCNLGRNWIYLHTGSVKGRQYKGSLLWNLYLVLLPPKAWMFHRSWTVVRLWGRGCPEKGKSILGTSRVSRYSAKCSLQDKPMFQHEFKITWTHATRKVQIKGCGKSKKRQILFSWKR